MNVMFHNSKSEHTSETGTIEIDNAERDSPEQITIYLSDGHYIVMTQNELDLLKTL